MIAALELGFVPFEITLAYAYVDMIEATFFHTAT